MPLLLIPEYSEINKEQRIPDRSETAHRKPPVKCFLTAPHSSILAWRIPWMEEPGGLQSMGPQRVRHN